MKHAPSVVIVSWQRSEYDDTPQVWVMLCQLQWSEHDDLSLRYEACSVSCHRLMTTVRVWWYSSRMRHALSVATVRAWLYIPQVCNMLCQLSSSNDNGQSMIIHPLGMKHALLVVVSWQRSEHDYISLRYETCSVSCHRIMPMDRAWLFIPRVWYMLRQLSSSHDNIRSMVIHPLGMQHAPSLVIVPWQQSDYGDTPLRYETCSVSCHHLMTTDRAWLLIPTVWNMLRPLSSSHVNGRSMFINP